MDISFLKELISCARGEIPSDVLIQNGTLVNVITRETYFADIAIYKNRIANVTNPGVLDSENAKKVINAHGKYVSPGFNITESLYFSELIALGTFCVSKQTALCFLHGIPLMLIYSIKLPV